MLRNQIYFRIKPLMPWGARNFVRRIVARRTLKVHRRTWPIAESAGQKPDGWPGWPDQKRFAFVITHDVEGPDGLAKCRQLAEIEMALGFRSSFNFIPEGNYAVPRELRDWLKAHGFEIGIHDLHHDGKLFDSRRGFEAHAKKINSYVREWGASGFRAGFMLRNLAWLHHLDVQYDSSTFDTDPFELQPDGANTIFPFWVAAPTLSSPSPSLSPSLSTSRNGYVELPYTLPQDSTLFFVLNRKSPSIWMRKLDWIVDHGGMALVNVHPDYVGFAGARRSDKEYPSSYYTDLLKYVAQKYAGQFWSPLPRAVAERLIEFRSSTALASVAAGSGATGPDQASNHSNRRLRGKRAAVLQFSQFPFDPRPRRSAQAMVEAGMEVDVVCIAEKDDEPKREVLNGVNVHRTTIIRQRRTKYDYLWEYGRFFVFALWFLTWRSLKRKYDVVHVHNMPDVLVFAALVPKARGAKIILDLHDPMPELMTSIRGMNARPWHVESLKRWERRSIAFADRVVTPNLAFRNLFVSRSCAPEKITVVMNSPEATIFDPDRYANSRPASRPSEMFRIMHHGLIAYRHGLDLLVVAVARLRATIPGVRLDIYGAITPFTEVVRNAARSHGIDDIVTFHGPQNQATIARAIMAADVGVLPNRLSAFTRLNLPTRIFEYLAMGCPVIAPATQGIKDYFTAEQLVMFEPDNFNDLVAKIQWVYAQPEAVRAVSAQGAQVYRTHLWEEEKNRFLDSVASLTGGPSGRRPMRVCMATHSFYETDNRVTRYAEALAARGDHVDVFALRSSPHLAATENIRGVNVHRIQNRFGKTERSKLSYVNPWLRFLTLSSWWVTRRHFRRRYDLVHIHNIPDFLVFAAWYPRLTGAKVILDIHDIVPEFYTSKFNVRPGSLTTKALRLMERCSAGLADHVIISNHLWHETYAIRTNTQDRCTVFINNVDTQVFRRRPSMRKDGKVIILFPGGLQWHQGLDIALRAFNRVSGELPHAEFHIYGDGNMKPALVELAAELGLNGKVKFFAPVRIAEIAMVMADADLGVVPKRADSFGNEAYSTKIMEFMSLGVPVVVSRTKIDQYYFDNSVVRFFASGDPDALADAMLEVLRNSDLRQRMVANALVYSVRNSWESRKPDYLRLVDSLCEVKEPEFETEFQNVGGRTQKRAP